MITGFDTVFISNRPGAPAVEEFLRHWRERWPSMWVCVGEEFVPGGERAGPLPPDQAHVLVARDEAMIETWDRDGYRPAADGEGPFMLMYRPCPLSRLRVLALEDPYGPSGFAFEPHELLLTGAGLSLVTTVTPDQDSAFSRLVTSEMAALLSVHGRT